MKSTRSGCGCLLIIFAVACEDSRATADADSTRESAYADTASIAARADSIDRYVDAHAERMTLFAAVSEKPGLVPVKDSASWPDQTETGYNTVADTAGLPLRHAQVPSSESGDWFAVETHYFAPNGRTILHQYKISGFSSGCTEVLRETRRTFLGPTGAVLAETRAFTDGAGSAIVADSCYRRSDDAPAPKPSASALPFLQR